MGSNVNWWTVYYGIELYYDYECIRKIFSTVSLYSDCTDSVIFLCGRVEPKYWKKFLEILCSCVSGGGNRGACLHYFFTICIITASSQSGRSCSDHGVELYWRIDFQYVGTGRSSEDVRQGSTGNDGIVKRTPESVLKSYSTMLLPLLYRIFPWESKWTESKGIPLCLAREIWKDISSFIAL